MHEWYREAMALLSTVQFARNGFAFRNLSPTSFLVAVGIGRVMPAHFHLPRQGGETWEVIEGSCRALRAPVFDILIGDGAAEELLQENPSATNVFDGKYSVSSLEFSDLDAGDCFRVEPEWLHGLECTGTTPVLLYAVSDCPDDRLFRKIASPVARP